MPYTATKEQQQVFMKDHQHLKQALNLGKEALWLTREECVKAGPSLEETLVLIRQALTAHGKKEYEMPAKIGVHPWSDVFYHAMPAYVPNNLACGIKWIACYPRNPKEFGLDQTTGLLVLNDIETGVPYAVMDCAWVTAMRTPAVSALTAAAFHPDAEYFGMFGCGVQGIEHVRFMSRALPRLKKIYINDVRPESEDQLIAAVGPEVDAELIKADPQTIAEKCEVMASATIILLETLSVVKREWVSPGQTILPCDLNTFWDPAIQREADKYFVDSIEEHRLFAGMGYFPGGLPEIKGETGEVLAGLIPGRTGKDELIVVSNIGMSVCDVVMGKAIFEKALQMGLGVKLPL